MPDALESNSPSPAAGGEGPGEDDANEKVRSILVGADYKDTALRAARAAFWSVILAHYPRAALPTDDEAFASESASAVERLLASIGESQVDERQDQDGTPSTVSEISLGDNVRHHTFGEGVVTQVQPGIVSVRFGDGSERQLALEYARLERISLAA
jgi:hypothetical protein